MKITPKLIDCQEVLWRFENLLLFDTEHEELTTIQKQLADVENSIANLVRAVEDGMPYYTAQSRIGELNAQRASLQTAIAEKKLSQEFKLTKDHITFFLEQFRDLDVTDRNCQKRLVETFINAIFLYDDKLKIAFNYSKGTTTMTLESIVKDVTPDVFGCDVLDVR